MPVPANSNIEMHYQPIVELASGHVAYCEALLRWREGDRLIPPGNRLDSMTSSQLAALDLQVFAAVEADVAAELLPAGVGVSVNVARPSDEVVLARFLDFAAKVDRKVVLELLETVTQEGLPCVLRGSSHGLLIAIDDFGTGHSSLARLDTLSAHVIKLDRTLTRQLSTGRHQGIARGLVSGLLGHGYQVVAEGIETEVDLRHVRDAGVLLGQGYLLCRPTRQIPTCVPLPKTESPVPA